MPWVRGASQGGTLRELADALGWIDRWLARSARDAGITVRCRAMAPCTSGRVPSLGMAGASNRAGTSPWRVLFAQPFIGRDPRRNFPFPVLHPALPSVVIPSFHPPNAAPVRSPCGKAPHGSSFR